MSGRNPVPLVTISLDDSEEENSETDELRFAHADDVPWEAHDIPAVEVPIQHTPPQRQPVFKHYQAQPRTEVRNKSPLRKAVLAPEPNFSPKPYQPSPSQRSHPPPVKISPKVSAKSTLSPKPSSPAVSSPSRLKTAPVARVSTAPKKQPPAQFHTPPHRTHPSPTTHPAISGSNDNGTEEADEEEQQMLQMIQNLKSPTIANKPRRKEDTLFCDRLEEELEMLTNAVERGARIGKSVFSSDLKAKKDIPRSSNAQNSSIASPHETPGTPNFSRHGVGPPEHNAASPISRGYEDATAPTHSPLRSSAQQSKIPVRQGSSLNSSQRTPDINQSRSSPFQSPQPTRSPLVNTISPERISHPTTPAKSHATTSSEIPVLVLDMNDNASDSSEESDDSNPEDDLSSLDIKQLRDLERMLKQKEEGLFTLQSQLRQRETQVFVLEEQTIELLENEDKRLKDKERELRHWEKLLRREVKKRLDSDAPTELKDLDTIDDSSSVLSESMQSDMTEDDPRSESSNASSSRKGRKKKKSSRDKENCRIS